MYLRAGAQTAALYRNVRQQAIDTGTGRDQMRLNGLLKTAERRPTGTVGWGDRKLEFEADGLKVRVLEGLYVWGLHLHMRMLPATYVFSPSLF